MGLVRSARSLELVRSAYESDGELVRTLIQLRKGQKDLIESLSASSGNSQAAVLRAIIDEWCEQKLTPQEQRA